MSTSLIDPFIHPLFARHGVELDLLRLDRIDPLISGNKWFKLLPLLERERSQVPIVSLGGAYSNHLHALARFGQVHKIATLGIVRTDQLETPTLQDCQNWGMELRSVSRELYRELCGVDTSGSHTYFEQLRREMGDFDLLPQGGSTPSAVKACAQIWRHVPQPSRYQRVICGVGTGTTLAGLIAGSPDHMHFDGISALAQVESHVVEIKTQLASQTANARDTWGVEAGAELRFGKVNAELAGVWQRAVQQGLELDPIYTLRALHWLIRQVLSGRLSDQQVLLVHTGGLQGLRGQQGRLSRLASAHCGPIPL